MFVFDYFFLDFSKRYTNIFLFFFPTQVNNLKLSDSKAGPRAAIVLKIAGAPGAASNKPAIEMNCQKKELRVMKPFNEISARISKMQKRGWKIKYPGDP